MAAKCGHAACHMRDSYHMTSGELGLGLVLEETKHMHLRLCNCRLKKNFWVCSTLVGVGMCAGDCCVRPLVDL